jgi:4-hydroxy-3-methylbut-2-enyl diphosphate reductase IspH
VERVGVTAGASTPDFSVDAVEARIRELVGA